MISLFLDQTGRPITANGAVLLHDDDPLDAPSPALFELTLDNNDPSEPAGPEEDDDEPAQGVRARLFVQISGDVGDASAFRVWVDGQPGNAVISAAEEDPQFTVWLPAVDSPVLRTVVIRAEGGGHAGFSTRIPVIQWPDGVDPPEETAPVVVTTPPALQFNPEAQVDAAVTGSAPAFTGGPLVGDVITQFLITDEGGEIVYDGDDPEHTGVMFSELTAPLPTTVDEAWVGERLAVRVTLPGIEGTVITWSDLSAEITTGEVEAAPPAMLAEQWEMTARAADEPNEATHFVPQFRLLGGFEPYQLQWARLWFSNYPEVPEDFWNYTTLVEGSLYDSRNSTDTAYWQIANSAQGGAQPGWRVRYRMSPTGPWSEPSLDIKSVTYQAAPPPSPDVGWHLIPFAEPQARAAGYGFSGGQQWANKAVRSKSQPDLIGWIQDVGGTWYSETGGQYWGHSEDQGLRSYFGVSLAIDPDDPNVWLAIGSNANWAPTGGDYNGIYRSINRGHSWTLVDNFSARGVRTAFRRTHFTGLAYDDTVAGTPTTRRVFALVPVRNAADDVTTYIRAELHRSDNGGQTWTKVRDLTTGTFSRVNTLVVLSRSGNNCRLALGTDNGLFESTDNGVNWTKRAPAGAGNYSVISIIPNPANANEVYVTVSSVGSIPKLPNGQPVPADQDPTKLPPVGLYRTTGGLSGPWSANLAPTLFGVSQVAVGHQNGGGWAAVGSRTLYLVGRSDGNHYMRVSHNGGSSWFTPAASRKPGKVYGESNASLSEPTSGGSPNSFRPTQIMPHPTNQNEVLIHSRARWYRSTDRGQNFVYSSDGFEGQQFQRGVSGLSFCEGPADDAWQHMFATVEDSGCFWSKNGGYSFNFTSAQLPNQPNPSPPPPTLSYTSSTHAGAVHPTDPKRRIWSVGHGNGPARLVMTRIEDPHNVAQGHVLQLAGVTQGNGARFMHWHKTNPDIVYWHNFKLTGANHSTNLPTRTNYGSGFSGIAYAVWPADNDYVMARSGNTLRWSQNAGNTWTEYVNVGWQITKYDDRFPVFAWHPSNNQIVFTMSASRDLARYNRTTNTWKTNYGLINRLRNDYPEVGTMTVRVESIAMDPQDPNVGAVAMGTPSFSAIYRSTNFQSDNPTWENVTYQIPRLAAPVLKFHPFNGELCAGLPAIGGVWMLQKPAGAVRPKPSIAVNFPIG